VLDPRVRDLSVVRGAGLARQDEPARSSADAGAASGLDVEDGIRLYGAADAPADAGRLRIVGVLRGDGPLVGAAGRVVVVPIGRAALLFSMTGVSRLDLGLEPGASLAAVEEALPGAIAEPYVRSTPADLAASLRASTEEFRAMMALVAAIALFTGAFLIFNTLSMTVTERVRDVSLLRARLARLAYAK
jgi:putative ABC transport system permease protein